MAFKRRAAGSGVGGVQIPAAPSDPTHMLKENKTKPGTPIHVVTACGTEGASYRGPGTTGLRTTIWRGEVTCPACMVTPGVGFDPYAGVEPSDGSSSSVELGT